MTEELLYSEDRDIISSWWIDVKDNKVFDIVTEFNDLLLISQNERYLDSITVEVLQPDAFAASDGKKALY